MKPISLIFLGFTVFFFPGKRGVDEKKSLLLLFISLFISHNSLCEGTENSSDDRIIAPLMPLSQELLVTISAENRERFISNVDLQQQLHEKILRFFMIDPFLG